MYNLSILMGNVGQDAEVKTIPSGQQVANFSLATSKSWKKDSGEWENQTTWHKIVCWGNLAQACEKIKKGDKVLVDGEIQTRSYENKEGVKVYVTEIKASKLKKINNNAEANKEMQSLPDGGASFASDQIPF